MKFLENLITKPKTFQRTIGLSIEQFKLFSNAIKEAWERAEQQRKSNRERKRKIGAGHPYKLNLEQLLFVTLLYYKAYLTQELIGVLVGLDQANVSRLLTKTRGIVEQSADPELKTYLTKAKEEYDQIRPENRINDWAAFIKKYPDLKEASSDATEQQCHRSQDNEIQKKHYSGKRKLHTLKTQITASESGRVLDVTESFPGSIHDKKIMDQDKTIQKIPENTCHRLDSGYQGVPKENPEHYIIIPIKKPRKEELSPFAKELNTVHSKRRVIVENVFSRFKKFKICKYVFRGPIKTYNQTFRNIAALLNFRLKNAAII